MEIENTVSVQDEVASAVEKVQNLSTLLVAANHLDEAAGLSSEHAFA